MKKFFIFMLSAAFLAAMVVLPAWADTLQLKNGTTVQGKYLGGDSNNVQLLVNGKVQSYSTSQILLLEFNSSSSAASAAAAPSSNPPAAHTASQKASTGSNSTANSTTGNSITFPAGTNIEVRMVDTVNSKTDPVGTKFQATLEQPLESNGTVVAPKDATVYGQLAQSQQAGTFAGKSVLQLELTGITINGNVAPIATSDYSVAGNSRGTQTAERAGIGAGIGAIIGAIAGGGKGAGIGAAVGGGAGAASQIITKGQAVYVPSETVLNFTLSQPLVVPAPSAQ